MKTTNRFNKGSGTYVCEDCGKLTRETGNGESEFNQCKDCMEADQQENAKE